jgi:biopolymer transport protein ExbB
MNIQERLTAFAMLGASWVMWLLVLLSVVVLAIVLERAYYFFATRDDIGSLKRDLLDALGRRDLVRARERLAKSRSFEAKIAFAGLEALDGGASPAEERIARETQLSKLSMERNLAFVGTVGNNAPFLGLLGTVIGIIRAFRELNNSTGHVSPDLMKEIGEALVATAIGILVALPAVAFFNAFQRAIKARVVRGEALGHDVLSFLKSEQPTEPAPDRKPVADVATPAEA